MVPSTFVTYTLHIKTKKGAYTSVETLLGGIVMRNCDRSEHPEIRDYGPESFIFNIKHATSMNQNFRTTLWTGQHLQLTLMSIPVCSDIGLECHPNVDQFIYVESGTAKVYMGHCQHHLHNPECVTENCAILIPAGTWHNIVNVGTCPLKLYSLYAPPQHPCNTVHHTKEDAEHKGH